MTDAEKSKRKAKPHQRSRVFRGLAIMLVLLLFVFSLFAVGVLTGVIRRPLSEFDLLSTQIARTNSNLELLISQTPAAGTANYFTTQTVQAVEKTHSAATGTAWTSTPRP